MSKTALIILAAVVVLIVIVVLTGMRFLRADDEDDFDGRSAERGRSADDDVPAGRGRRGDDRDWPATGGRAREARTSAGRTAHNRTAHGRTGRGETPQRPGKPVRRGQNMADEPVPAGARAGRPPADRGVRRGPRDYDDRPARPAVGAREYESREYADREYDDRDGRGTRQARGGRDQDVRSGRDDLPRRDDGRRDESRPDVARRGARGSSRAEDRQDDGPPSRREDSRREDSLPAVRPRQGRVKRDGDEDWPSNEWDELSDVDYWAELASDRPLTTTMAQPSAPAERPVRAETRRDPDARDTDSGQIRGGRHGSTGEHEAQPRLPVRPARQHVRADAPAAASAGNSNNSGEFGLAAARRASEQRSEPTLAMLANMGPAAEGFRPPGPADDDPLTSPSFPRIAADDSRSYRRGRPEPRSQDPRVPDVSGRTERTEQFSGHQPAAAGIPGAGLEGAGQRGATAPGGYPHPAGNGPDYAAAALTAGDSRRRVPAGSPGHNGYPIPAPTADPGGFLPPVPAGYPALAAGTGQHSGGYGSSSGADGYPVAATGGYPIPAPIGRPAYPADASTVMYSSPPAAASHQASATGGYPLPGGDGYQARLAGQGGHQAAASRDYLSPSAQSIPAGYPASYPADAGASAHQIPAAGGYPAGPPGGGYPAPAEPAGYPSYGNGGLSGGGTVPYLPPGASGASGVHGLARGGELDSGYPSLPAGPAGPFAATSTSGYQSPPSAGNAGFGGGYPVGSAQPGVSDGQPAGQFQSAPYEPAGYPAPVYEAGGYAGADPYAMDPYGYQGYRSGF